ncbi:hypothetical protein [Nostoc sp.]|uniref:hypothetical protein n=1 Tax=Nostoc sp. TaxID=1180 RepID=UPI002FF8DC1C
MPPLPNAVASVAALHKFKAVQLRIIVGWVERSETQQSTENVGFRPSTQPTLVLVFDFNPSVLLHKFKAGDEANS